MTLPSLLITRPQARARSFAAQVAKLVHPDVAIVVAPLLEIVPTNVTIDLSGYGGVIFSSSYAVDLAPDNIRHPAYCVGRRTAEQATAAGWTVQAVGQTADDLVAQIAGLAPTYPLVHLAGRHRRGDIMQRLTALGIPIDVLVLYDQRAVALTAQALELLKGEAPVVVPLFSPRTAAQFFDQVKHLRNVHIVAMSDAVAQCCFGFGIEHLSIAAEPTGQEMLRSVEKLVCDISLA